MNQIGLISWALIAPLLFGIIILFIKRESEKLIKYISFFGALISFAIFFAIYLKFDKTIGDFQFIEEHVWISALNIKYKVGIDGLSLLLGLLTVFITPIAIFSSFDYIKHKVKEYYILLLFLEVGMLGVFVSLDMFLFYVFWEAMLIPMYFLIGIWGGEQRIYASIKFFIYTMTGSLLMLIAIIWAGIETGKSLQQGFTSDFVEMSKYLPMLDPNVQKLLFLAFALSFAIKVPLFPFHTWLPDAHVQAPTAGSVILAGILLKMGTYGLMRFCLNYFPEATIYFAPYISILAIIGIVYGALVAMVQTDMKKLVAYSSVSHLGFVVLGIFALTPEAMQGAAIQMANHGLSTGALFLLVGFIYERAHTKEIAKYGGIAKIVPFFAFSLLFASLSSIGLPGLNGFIGEFLILLGAFKSNVLSSHWYAILASTGVIFAAVYLLWMYQRVCFGDVKNQELKHLEDLNKKDLISLFFLFVFIVWIGLYPNTFLQISEASIEKLIMTVVK